MRLFSATCCAAPHSPTYTHVADGAVRGEEGLGGGATPPPSTLGNSSPQPLYTYVQQCRLQGVYLVDSAIGGEEAVGGGVEDGAAGPLLLVAVQLVHPVLGVHVGGKVVGCSR